MEINGSSNNEEGWVPHPALGSCTLHSNLARGTPIARVLPRSKEARRGGLLSVSGPEMQMQITDRKVLGKECHKKQGIVMQPLELHRKMSFPSWYNICSHLKV